MTKWFVGTAMMMALASGCGLVERLTAKPATVGTERAKPPAIVRIDPAQGGSAAKSNAFVALERELARAQKELAEKGKPAPYFIGYEVHDRREVIIAAQFGAIMQSNDRRSRVLDVDVRVGSHELDSTHALRNAPPIDFSTWRPSPLTLPLDDENGDAVAAAAWAETDRKYKAAVEKFLNVEAEKQVRATEEDSSADFSKEEPVVFVEPPAAIEVDGKAWEDRIRALSARFRSAPEVHDATVTLQVTTVNEWVATSEGTSVQTGRNYVRIFMTADTRAEDGMELSRYETFDAETFDGLPSAAVLERATDTMVADLRALRAAPPAEPYTGPAILEGEAAGVFFHEIFGHRIEGHRQKREEEGQTFAKKIGEKVLPEFLSVYDDPTIRKIGKTELSGFYRFDDEGVIAQRADLVKDGVLETFLLGRSPVRGFDRSNGHGRRQEGRPVVARQANLVVESSSVVAPGELRKLMLAEAERQGLSFGLVFKQIAGGFTLTERSGPQAFKVNPVMVYRVFVDGRPDELVRGADLVGTPLTSLSKILAAGDDYRTFNGVCGAESGWVPVSATSPSLLVGQIEVERREKGSDRQPLLAAPDSPPVKGKAPADDAVVRRALEDELRRSMTELQLASEPKPYFVSYAVQDYDVSQVTATFGAITNEGRNRWRALRTQVRVGDPTLDGVNSFAGGGSAREGNASLSIEDDYAAIRRDLWLRTDEAYKSALDALSKKRAAASSDAQGDDEGIPDFATELAAKVVEGTSGEPASRASIAGLTETLSAAFRDYASIATSRVSTSAVSVRRRLLSSEGTWIDERQQLVRVDVSAETQADDGMTLKDRIAFVAPVASGLPPVPEMVAAVLRMAEGLETRRTAPAPEGGDALVLFEGPAAGQILRMLLADQVDGTPPAEAAGRSARSRRASGAFASKIGQKVSTPELSAFDDPRAERAADGTYLLGQYRADEEGVPARKISILEKGVLKTLLMSRTPSRDLRRSTGHGRLLRGNQTAAHISNLFVRAEGGLSTAALRKQAAAAAAKAGIDAYVVRLIDDPRTTSSLGDLEDIATAAAAFQAARSGGSPAVPALIAARLTVDGKEEPVRGLEIEGLVPRSLKQIVAAGKDPHVLNYIDGFGGGGIPSTIVAPALLFEDIEVRKQAGRYRRPPLYPRPELGRAS